MAERPVGALTFLFTDIEGSTQLAHALGTERWGDVLQHHAEIIRGAVAQHSGVDVRTEGDSFFLVFPSARQAVAAAADAQRALASHDWPHGVRLRVRMGLHTGEEAALGTPEIGTDYLGYDVHRAARVSAAAHGGQVLLSTTTKVLLGDNLPTGVTLRDLGEHRLKDLSQPDRLYQLVIEGLPDAFPPLRTLLTMGTFPRALTPLIGREREIAALHADLLQPEVRLVTLTGAGGSGKTRLAIEVASGLRDQFTDGAAFVPLAPITDPELVLLTMARTLGVFEKSGRPVLASLIAVLANAQQLIVIDNFEQVLSASTSLSDLLSGCPGLKFLATSRSALRLSGEHEFPVPPLSIPDPANLPALDRLSEFDSIKLFVQRARAVRPDFQIGEENARAVAAICVRLDGLPLAIELAAARIRVLSPQEIATRLDHRLSLLTSGPRDLPARQRTLRDTIAWSYELLDDAERRLFRRLAPFAGGWTMATAEAVCDGDLPLAVLDGLDLLVGKNLVRLSETARGEPRFNMLQTIREYAGEQLHESGEAERIHEGHAGHYLTLAEASEERLEGPDQAAAIGALEEERENLRAALDWYIERGDFERAAGLAGGIVWFWWLRGYLTEGRSALERALALPEAAHRTRWRAKALHAVGMIAMQQNDFPFAGRWLEEALAIRRELGDRPGVADSLHFLGDVILNTVGPEAARKTHQEALDLARSSGRTFTIATLLWHLAFDAILQGAYASARAILEECFPIARQLGNPWALALAFAGLGTVIHAEGDPAGSETYLREAISLLRGIGDRFMLLVTMIWLAATLADEGEAEPALRLLGAAEAEAERVGSKVPPVVRLPSVSGAIERGRASISREAADGAYAAGRAMPIEDAVDYALRA